MTKWISVPYVPLDDSTPNECEASRHKGAGIKAEYVQILYNLGPPMVIRMVWLSCEACHLDMQLDYSKGAEI